MLGSAQDRVRDLRVGEPRAMLVVDEGKDGGEWEGQMGWTEDSREIVENI